MEARRNELVELRGKHPSVVPGHRAQPSPTKIVELRSKYMQQLSEVVKLKEIGEN